MSSILLLALLAGPAAAPAAQDAPAHSHTQVPTVSRLVQRFHSLEKGLLDSVRARDAPGVEGLLLEDFEVRNADRPGTPVPRDEWIQASLDARMGVAEVDQMAVRMLDQVAVVSFRLTEAKRPACMVVDAWVQRDGVWKLAARYRVGS